MLREKAIVRDHRLLDENRPGLRLRSNLVFSCVNSSKVMQDCGKPEGKGWPREKGEEQGQREAKLRERT